MKSFLLKLKNKRFISIFILIFIAFFVYFFFPYVMIAEFAPFDSIWVRIITIIACIVIYYFCYYRKVFAKERTAENLNDENKDNPSLSSKGLKEDKKIPLHLKSIFEENLKILKNARSDENKNLYSLPWYLVIGPSDSGKTSTLQQNKILLSLKDKFSRSPLDKTLPTKFCEWWFSNDAVFLDTCGSFCAPAGETNWEFLLKSIHAARSQKALNGIIVCYSLSDLVYQDEIEFSNQAWNLKKKLQEINDLFGTTELPVYIIFTKVDLLTGFNEYFHRFDKTKIDQILGISFPQKNNSGQQTNVDLFENQFDSIGSYLRKMSFGLLQRERNELKRAFILEFPEEFMSLKKKIYSFLSEIFSKNRFENNLFLRGVYFASAGSLGMAIDPIGMESSYQYSYNSDLFQNGEPARVNEAFFLKDLFTEVIIPDRELAIASLNVTRKNLFVRKLVYGSSLFAILLCTILWSISYSANRSYLFLLDTELSKYTPAYFSELWDKTQETLNDQSILNVLQNLNEMSLIPGGYEDEKVETSVAFPLKGVGLYQGNKMNEAAKKVYLQSLQKYFLPYLKNIIEAELATHTDNLLDLYQTLQAYLMLKDQSHFDIDYVSDWFNRYWERSLLNQSNKNVIQEQLTKHLNAVLVENLYNASLDKNLVEQSRVLLRQLPDEIFIFENIKHAHLSFIPRFYLTPLQAHKAEVAFERSDNAPLNTVIPSVYTKLGYMTLFYTNRLKYFGKSAFETKNWILGDTKTSVTPLQFIRNSNEIYKKVKKIYLEEYLSKWSEYFNTIRIKKFSNLQDALNITGVLVEEDSPLKVILTAVRKNTILSPSFNDSNDKEENKTSFFKNSLSSLNEESPVDIAFFSLNQLLKKDTVSGKVPLEDIILGITEIRAAFLNLQQNNSTGPVNVPKELQFKILTLAAASPVPINNWLTSLVDSAGVISKKQSVKNINAIWQKILPECKQILQNKYPFCTGCASSVSIDGFAKLFGYNGVIDNFLKTNLSEFAETNTYPWQWKEDAQNSSEGIKELEKASRIRDAFFQTGSQNLQVNFSIKPTFLDSSVLTEQLSSSGQSIFYAHGPERATVFTWPSSNGSTGTTLSFNMQDGGEVLRKSIPGFWSIFQFLQQSRVSINSNNGNTSFSVTLGGKQANFDIYPTQGGSNPFANPSIFNFRCPSHL